MQEDLLNYADPSLINQGTAPQPEQSELGANPMLSSDDSDYLAQQAAISGVEETINPLTSGLQKRDEQATNQGYVDPELMFEGNLEKGGKSLVAGVGIVVNDIGNMIDYAAMTMLPDEVRKSDTFMNLAERLPNFHEYGDALQKWGEVHQSPGLDEFTLDDMFKAEFWFTDVAKTLPYMAAMFVPGAQGAGIARGLAMAGAKSAAKRGLFGSAKRMLGVRAAQETAKAAAKGGAKAVAGAAATTGGSGVMGALATSTAAGEIGLTSLGSGLATWLGAGTASTTVIGAGLAGDVYNRALDMGMTEEEAGEAAHGTFIDNMAWIGLNGLSWGVQFGGVSGRAFRAFNKIKGGAQTANQLQKTFGQRLMQHARRGAASGTFEGTEEMFQETYETWIQEKNLAEAKGEEFISYTDFLTSDENRKTLGVSFAAGFLMGGKGGFMNSVAENGRRITNKRVSIDDDINMYENMNEAQRKVRTLEIIEAAVREDQLDGLNGTLDKLQKAGKISTEERVDLDNIIVEYAEIAATLPFKEKLTEVGQQTLFNLKVKQNQNNKAKTNLEALKDKSLQEANDNLTGKVLNDQIALIEAEHAVNMTNLENEMNENNDAVAKLLTSKKYSEKSKGVDKKRVSEINKFVETEEYNNMSDSAKQDILQERQNLQERIKEDSYVVNDALSMTESEFQQFTTEGAEQKAVADKEAAEAAGVKAEQTAEKGKEKAKSLFEKGKELFGKAYNATRDFAKKQALSFKESSAIKRVTKPITEDVQKLVDEGKSAEEISEFIKSKLTPEQIEKSGVTKERLNELIDEASAFYTGAKPESETAEAETEEELKTDPETVTVTDEEVFAEIRKRREEAAKEGKGSGTEGLTTQEEIDAVREELIKAKQDAESESVIPEGEEQISSEEAEKESQKSTEQAKEESKSTVDSILDFARNVAKKSKKLLSRQENKELDKAITNLGKTWSKFAPNVKSKKLKVEEETTKGVLSYYASINPGLHGAVMEAASKKFPDKQLLILRNVIDEHGSQVGGYAMGSAVLAKEGSDLGIRIMHEYGHVYYDMLKDNPSFMRGVNKIIGSDIYNDVKKQYAELVLYKTSDGNIISAGDLISQIENSRLVENKKYKETIEAFREAVKSGDGEAINSLANNLLNKLQEDGVAKVLPDEQQVDIIEEAFVTSLAPQLVTKLDLLFKKPAEAKEYKSFIRRTTERVAKMFTPSDSKKILSELDRGFENLTTDEMYTKIADDFAKGTQGGSLKFQNSRSKKLKLNRTFSASIAVAINKMNPNMYNTMSVQELSKTAIDFATQYSKSIGEDIKITKELREEVESRVLIRQESMKGFTLSPSGKTSGVSSIYKAAGMKQNIPSDLEQQQENFDEVESLLEESDIGADWYMSAEKAMDNSTSTFITALMKIANPDSRNITTGKPRYQKSKLEAGLLNMAHSNRDNVNDFTRAFMNSNEGHIKKAREIMQERLSEGEMYAAIRDIHNNYRNKFIESILNTTVTSDGSISESVAIHDSERRRVNAMKKAGNQIFFKNNTLLKSAVLERISAAQAKINKGQKLSQQEGLEIATAILRSVEGLNNYLDYDQLANIRLYRGNRLLNVQDYIADIISDKSLVDKKTGKTYLSQGKIPVMNMVPLFKSMVIASRGKNAIKSVSDVNGNMTLAFNYNNNLLNNSDVIINMAKTPEGRKKLAKKYLKKRKGKLVGNPFVEMVIGLGVNGMADQAYQIGFDGGVISYRDGDGKGVKFEQQTKDDIVQFDMEKFASNWDSRKPGKSRSFYTQPIAIFANSKRRYSIASPMATTEAQKQKVISGLIAKKDHKVKYKDGQLALGFEIKANGKYDISQEVSKMKQWFYDNPNLIKSNKVLFSFAKVTGNRVAITPQGEQMIEDYVFNYMVNSYYAQQLFVGKHGQAKSQADYIKRATGAIARHDGSMRGVAIEPMIYKDVDENGVNATDAGAFILPEDVPMIQDRVSNNVGRGFKFVYYGSDMRVDDENTNMVGDESIADQDYYFKTYVHVLDSEFIADSPELQKIERELRARKKFNNDQQNMFGETLNIAMYESAAKKAPSIHGTSASAESFEEGSNAWNQLNDAYMSGNKVVGIDGSNMGIQLPMDKYREEVVEPTQMSAADLNELTPEQLEDMEEILKLRQEALDLALEESAGDILSEGIDATPEARAKSKEAVVSKISKSSVAATFNGIARYQAITNPRVSQNLPSLSKFYGNSIRSSVKKSSKVMTAGTIAIQGVAVGKGLKGYFDENGKEYIGMRYEVQADGTTIKKPAILPAEAIVPAGLKGKYFSRVNEEFNNETEAKRYADGLIVDTAASTDLDKAGVRIKGLNRKFPSKRAAKEFLYNKIAVQPDGKFIILGDEFFGPRVPAHGKQSKPIMEIKGFQKEVLDKNGKHLNNHIQVSPEINRILGSDHDGDSLFINLPYENPKTKRQEKVNELLSKQFKFYRNVAMFDLLTASMEYESGVEARIKAIQKKNPNKVKRSSQTSPIGASEFFEENVQGSGMIGTIAALNNGMSYAARYGVEIGVKGGITIDGKTIDKFQDDTSLKGKESLSFKNAVLLNIALDNTKNQHATALGMNPSTISAVAFMTRLGFDSSSLDSVFTSKAAELYAKFKGKKALKDQTFINTNETSAAVLAYMNMLGGTAEQARKALDNSIAFGVNIDTSKITSKPIDQMTAIEKQQMISVLAMFEIAEGVTKDIYAINNMLGQHKNVSYNEHEANKQLEDYNNIIGGKSSLKGNGLTEMNNNPVIKSYKDRLAKTSAIYQSNNITGTVHASSTMELIENLTGNENIARRDGDEQSKIVRDVFTNTLQNTVPMFKKTLKHLGNFEGDRPEPRVNKVVRNLQEKIEDKGLQDNLFIQSTQFSFYEGYGNNMNKYTLKPNVDFINEYTTDGEILTIRKAFSELPLDVQEDIFIVDSIVNELGYRNTSVQPLFDMKTLEKLSEEIDTVHQEVIDDLSDIISPELMAESIILDNPEIIPTAARIHAGASGSKFIKGYGTIARVGTEKRNGIPVKIKAVDVANKAQKDLMITNQPHYVKIGIPGKGIAVYKYKPFNESKVKSGKASKLDQAKRNGLYELVDVVKPDPKKGKQKRSEGTNLLKMQNMAKKKPTIAKSKKMKFSHSRSSEFTGYSSADAEMFSLEEYLEDKGHNVRSVMKNKVLKEAMESLYKNYVANFNLAQEFDRTIIQTGRIKRLSEEKLYDYASVMQKLDPSALSSAHKAVVLELAKRASEVQKASRNGIDWTDKGDISWLHAWFGSNNIPGHRPEIQNLIRTMEKEYGKFMEENIKFQTELDRLTKNLIRSKIAEDVGPASKVAEGLRWIMGSYPSWTGYTQKMYENMYDKVDVKMNGIKTQELKLKTTKDFLATKPTQAEVEFYTFFKETTNKYGRVTQQALGERYKEGYIPHIKMGLFGSIKQRGLFGLYDYMLQGTGDINHVKVKGYNPMTGKQEILPFHQWKLVYYSAKGTKGGFKSLVNKKQFKSAAKLDIIRKRAEKLAKQGKHDDGTNISMTEQEIHGTMGTSLMSRFTQSRGVRSAMFASEDLGMALSQYVNTTLFTYGNENFRGFKSMTPLLDGVIEYNKTKGNKNAVTYLENVWKKGFYTFKDSQFGMGRLGDNALHQLVKLTRIRYLSLGFGGGFGNLMVGKYNEFRSKGGKNFLRGESRYWGQRKKAWALIKNQLNPEKFAYDLIQGNDSSGLDTILMSPYIGSEHYIQGSGFVSQFTEEEWGRISEDGEIPADMQDKVDLYIDNVTRQQGYGYSKVDQIGIATYSWGKAIMQFKKWMPTSIAERFQKETIDRFGEMRSGSNREAFIFGANFTRKLIAGEESIKNFRKRFNELPKSKQEAVKTFFRGMQVVSALTILSMLFGDSDDEELRGLADLASDTRDDIMFMTDPRRLKYMAEPASWSLVESGATMAVGIATADEAKFVGGLRGVSWTAAQVLKESKSLEN